MEAMGKKRMGVFGGRGGAAFVFWLREGGKISGLEGLEVKEGRGGDPGRKVRGESCFNSLWQLRSGVKRGEKRNYSRGRWGFTVKLACHLRRRE